MIKRGQVWVDFRGPVIVKNVRRNKVGVVPQSPRGGEVLVPPRWYERSEFLQQFHRVRKSWT